MAETPEKKLLDTHISASEVLRLNEPVNIFDETAFQKVVEAQGTPGDGERSLGAEADMIAHATKCAIHERLEQDTGLQGQGCPTRAWRVARFRDQAESDRDTPRQDLILR